MKGENKEAQVNGTNQSKEFRNKKASKPFYKGNKSYTHKIQTLIKTLTKTTILFSVRNL